MTESQSQEIGQSYQRLSKLYNVNLEDLVYGEDGFMKSCYPEGFPDFAGDVIFSEKYWDEFEKWLKDTKGIELIEPEDDLNETVDMVETYSEEELRKMEGKVFNQQRLLNTYRSSKYGISQLFAHTKCTKCGKEKRVLLSNLVKDPEKYGSCKCSEENEEGRARKIVKIYKGKEKLPTNTSGYTGVYHLKTYNGKPYDKWRAVIEIDGEKKFLGDFDTRREAADARKKAAKEGVKWYKKHNPYFKEDLETK